MLFIGLTFFLCLLLYIEVNSTSRIKFHVLSKMTELSFLIAFKLNNAESKLSTGSKNKTDKFIRNE